MRRRWRYSTIIPLTIFSRPLMNHSLCLPAHTPTFLDS
jgi:hypothetical protein